MQHLPGPKCCSRRVAETVLLTGGATDKQFTGHQRERDFYYMQARFPRLRSGQAYDPSVGRLLESGSIVRTR